MAADLGRIKGNVAKMVSQGAPEKDIDAYIAAEGTSIDAIKAFKTDAASQPTGYDAGLPAQGLSGVYEGAADVLGAPVDLVNLGLRAGAAGVHAMGGPDVQFPVEPVGGSQSIQGALGGLIKPPTDDPTNQFVRNTARNVVAATVPVGGEIAKAAQPARAFAAAVAPAVVGGALGAGAQQAFPGNPYANALGMVAGSAGGVGAVKGLRRALSPFPISPERAAMNATMADNGVDLTAGQQAGNKPLQYVESELGGGPASGQGQQFTQAALKRANMPGAAATPDVISGARQAIGQQFEDLANRNPFQGDRQMAEDMQSVWSKYENTTNPNTRAPLIENILLGVADRAGFMAPPTGPGVWGAMDGAFYNSQMRDINEALRDASGPELTALQKTKSLLEDAMERSMVASGSPDVGAFQQARRDWKNMLIIQDAAGRAGSDAAYGIISPAALRGAVGATDYALGRGDLSDLSRAGIATMTPLPNSGTTPRAMVHAIPAAIGSALGAAGHGELGAALGMGAGFAAPYAAAPAMFSKPVQAWLTNQRFAAPVNGAKALVGPAVGSLSQMLDAESTQPGPLQITVDGATPSQ